MLMFMVVLIQRNKRRMTMVELHTVDTRLKMSFQCTVQCTVSLKVKNANALFYLTRNAPFLSDSYLSF